MSDTDKKLAKNVGMIGLCAFAMALALLFTTPGHGWLIVSCLSVASGSYLFVEWKRKNL